MTIWIFIACFFVILGVLIVINYRVNDEFKIETTWLALALSPVIIWLLTTQQLTEFSGFGLGFKLQAATSKQLSIDDDGDSIKPEQISADEKEGLSKIPSFIQRQVSALTLKINKRGYYNNQAITTYLEELTPFAFFEYVLFVQESGEFVGIVDARRLLYEIREKGLSIVTLIEAGNVSFIPGIRIVKISDNSTKKDALQLMDTKGLSELPVVNALNQFIGIVERDKITSSIVVQLVSSSEN